VIAHAVEIVGFGQKGKTPYWIGKNSWGTAWGEDGFFKIIRGIDHRGIESLCTRATPSDESIYGYLHHTTDAEQADPRNNLTNSIYQLEGEKFLAGKNIKKSVIPVREGQDLPPLPKWRQSILSEVSKNLPQSLDWRNVSGNNFLSWT